MKISEFSRYLNQLEQTASRNEMTEILAELFSEMDSNQARSAAYLALGKLAPAHEGVEINIAEKLMVQILQVAYEASQEEVQEMYNQAGDLGNAAEQINQRSSGQEWTVQEVHKKLLEIAHYEGSGSQDRKIRGFAELLHGLDSLSARFVVRIPLEKLRLGFSELTLLDALSVMEAGDKSLRAEVERAYSMSADIGSIVETFKQKGKEGIQKIEMSPGTPVRMSSAERLPTAEKIIEKLGEAYIEPKMDGFRVQVHIFQRSENKKQKASKEQQSLVQSDKEVKIFSRNLEDTTEMFPDIVQAARDLDVDSAIFEGEAVGYDPNTGEFLPFQETMQRKRKYDIQETAREIPLRVFVFDLLYLNGFSISEKPYKERRQKLLRYLPDPNTAGTILAARVQKVSTAEAIEDQFDAYIAEGLEGAVIKKIDAPYEAGSRGFHWIKFKRSQRGELEDTIDAVVMGYYYGRGKRNEFGIGAFLIGVRSQGGDGFTTIAKVGTGLTDEEWREMKERADKVAVKNKPDTYTLSKEMAPDIWMRPDIVVEIEADEITRSPIHTAAPDKDGKGLALRFPRLKQFRDDKASDQATSEKELTTLFENQFVR